MSAPQQTQAVVKQQKQPPPSIPSCLLSDQWKQEVQKVIPKEIVLEAMLRVARSTASDSKFANCDPKSFLLALLKCGRAGLYPDGREAHLIPFGKEVQALFDVKGICALARRAGILVTPKVVFSADEFTVEEDDGTGKTRIVHRVDYRANRGDIQAVYSRAVMPDGQVDYEIMSVDEVESVRQHYSRAKDSSPWKNSWGEMAKKTVIKRHSKRWDMSPEIRQLLNADDDTPPPFNEPKISAPIFTAPVKEIEAAPAKTTPTDLDRVRMLCKSDSVDEKELLAFLADIGICDSTSLEQAEPFLNIVLSQWEDIAKRIKSTPASTAE